MVPDRIQAFVQRLVEALESKTSDALLAIMQREALLIGTVDAQLEVDGKRYLRGVMTYANRWVAEGGPHPPERRRERSPSILDQMPLLWHGDAAFEPTYRTIVKPGLPEWSEARTQMLRGQLIQVLLQLTRSVDSSVPAPAGKLVRKGTEKARGREDDILCSLPSGQQMPLKSMTELEQRLTRAGRVPWDRTTLARSVKKLRADGLVDAQKLRRSAEGDRRIDG